MHNNYYFLRQLTQSLNTKLTSAILLECFSQNRDELILCFSKNNKYFFIKAYLDPSFCCLSFPENFSRARKNSVDLFQVIINRTVEEVRQFDNERCFSIVFEGSYQLLFKMHGNRSNLILFKKNDVYEIFKHNLKNDHALKIGQLNRNPEQSYEAFLRHDQNYTALFPTFGGVIKSYIESKFVSLKSANEKWQVLQYLLTQLTTPPYYITDHQHKLHLSLLKTGQIKGEYADPIIAITQFFYKYISAQGLQKSKRSLLMVLNKQARQNQNYINKTEGKLREITHAVNYSHWADILMANLHCIPARAREANLENFYDSNKPISIKLKPDLTPQKNAENYYRKAKNQAIEIKTLRQNLEKKKTRLLQLQQQKAIIDKAEDQRSLNEAIKVHGLIPDKKEIDVKTTPFHQFTYQGFSIFIGKNAKNNDLMLQKYSFKDDLWLHAKDVSGSHVLIKHQAGKNFPKDVIEKGAELAGYYSKRKNDSLCPVIVTPRKYVRKRKGAPPGAVVVDKELQVILVRPGKRDPNI